MTTTATTDTGTAIVAAYAARIAELEARVAELEYEATHDALTGALNRRGLYDLVAGLTVGWSGTVTVVDGNGVKATNDAFGHEAGDALIISMASELDKLVSSMGVVARTGGDEFVVLTRGGGPESTERYAAGSAPYTHGTDIFDDAIKIADSRMYASKGSRARGLAR